MLDLSLHILDLAENSFRAGASRILLSVSEDTAADRMEVAVADNGKGMDSELQKRVTDPFVTTRAERRIGLGIPLMKLAAEQTGGSFSIESEPEKGTRVRAVFVRSSVDRPPLGDMAGTLFALMLMEPAVDFTYERTKDGKGFKLDRAQIGKEAGENPGDVSALGWMQAFVCKNEQELNRRCNRNYEINRIN